MKRIHMERSEIIQYGGFQDSSETVQNSVPSRNWKRLKTDQYRTVQDTCELILHVLYESGEALSRAQIAKAINRAKTPSLIALIEGMVIDGYLARFETRRPNGIVMYWYEPSS